MSAKVTIGRIVHYNVLVHDESLRALAAIVTHVYRDGSVSLCIFGRDTNTHEDFVAFSDSPKAGHWNWPPRSDS